MAVNINADCDSIIAHLAGVNAAVERHAADIGVRAQAGLSSHRETGAARIEVEHETVDSFVSLVDEAALSIEYGHVTRPGKTATQRFVPGLRILRNAAHL